MIYKENYFKFYPVPLRKHEFTLVKIKESKNVKCENKCIEPDDYLYPFLVQRE